MPTQLTGRARRIVVALLVSVSAAAVSCTADGEASEPTAVESTQTGTYLALGDSVPFGFRGGSDPPPVYVLADLFKIVDRVVTIVSRHPDPPLVMRSAA